MKAIKTAMLGVAIMFSFAGAAAAETLEVKIPFPFIVGATQLPAGTYRIERNSDTSSSIVRIQGEHGNTAHMFVLTTPLERGNPVREPVLVFVPDETANRLTAIWESSGTGHEVSARRGHSKLAGQIVVKALPRT
jgi:hypothetical protein